MEQYDSIKAAYFFNLELTMRNGLNTDYKYVDKYNIWDVFDVTDISPVNMNVFKQTIKRYEFNHFFKDKEKDKVVYNKDDFQSCYNVCKYMSDDNSLVGIEFKEQAKRIRDKANRYGFVLDDHIESLNMEVFNESTGNSECIERLEEC